MLTTFAVTRRLLVGVPSVPLDAQPVQPIMTNTDDSRQWWLHPASEDNSSDQIQPALFPTGCSRPRRVHP